VGEPGWPDGGCSRRGLVSVVVADPYRQVRGFQGAGYYLGQVAADRVQVDGIFEPGRERHHGLVGVIPGAVEPPVHRVLHPAARGAEQCHRSQRGGGDRHRPVDPEHLGGQQHQPGVDPDQQAGDDGVGQGAGDDPVDRPRDARFPLACRSTWCPATRISTATLVPSTAAVVTAR
jgi:hypothetical protein